MRRYNCRDDVHIVSTLRLALFTKPYTLLFHHLPHADDAAVADQLDQVNAGGVLRQVDCRSFVRDI